MAFEIVIKESVTAKTLTRRQWTKVGTLPDGRDEMGYTPEEHQHEIIQIERLKQTVDALDLPAVIRAINSL